MLFNTLFQWLQGEYPQRIEWRRDHEGRSFSPERLWDEYCKVLELTRENFMESPTGWVDRHKIVALTQELIWHVQPVEFVFDDSIDEEERNDELARINTDFAFLFGIHFVCKMNEKHYPTQRFDNPANHFDTERFIYPILHTNEGKDFVREHKKYLMAVRRTPFPQFLIAQLWTVIEQWGLAYARAQKGWPMEK